MYWLLLVQAYYILHASLHFKKFRPSSIKKEMQREYAYSEEENLIFGWGAFKR